MSGSFREMSYDLEKKKKKIKVERERAVQWVC